MTEKQIRYNRFYMDIAERVSHMSYARRLKVGAILVKDDNIISFGWNGMPSGWDNNCEIESIDNHGNEILTTKPEVLHAESNVLMKLLKTGGVVTNAILYITHAPCINCSKLIHQSGIKEVYYKNVYREVTGIYFLKECGVKVEKI